MNDTESELSALRLTVQNAEEALRQSGVQEFGTLAEGVRLLHFDRLAAAGDAKVTGQVLAEVRSRLRVPEHQDIVRVAIDAMESIRQLREERDAAQRKSDTYRAEWQKMTAAHPEASCYDVPTWDRLRAENADLREQLAARAPVPWAADGVPVPILQDRGR